MADFWYTKGINNLCKGNVVLGTDTLRVYIVDAADYTPDKDADDALDDIAAGGRVAYGNLDNVTWVAGTAKNTLDADDEVLTSVTGDPTEYAVVCKVGAGESTSYLLTKADASVTPNGGNITVQFNASGIGYISN